MASAWHCCVEPQGRPSRASTAPDQRLKSYEQHQKVRSVASWWTAASVESSRRREALGHRSRIPCLHRLHVGAGPPIAPLTWAGFSVTRSLRPGFRTRPRRPHPRFRPRSGPDHRRRHRCMRQHRTTARWGPETPCTATSTWPSIPSSASPTGYLFPPLSEGQDSCRACEPSPTYCRQIADSEPVARSLLAGWSW
jgi:hypothetical protein